MVGQYSKHGVVDLPQQQTQLDLPLQIPALRILSSQVMQQSELEVEHFLEQQQRIHQHTHLVQHFRRQPQHRQQQVEPVFLRYTIMLKWHCFEFASFHTNMYALVVQNVSYISLPIVQ